MGSYFAQTKFIFRRYIQKYSGKILLIWALVFAAVLLGFLENVLNQYLFDEIILYEGYDQLPSFILVFIGINAVCLCLAYIVGKQNLCISQLCSMDMRMDLMDNIHRANMSEVNDRKSSEIMVRMMEDVTIVCGFLNNYIIANSTTLITILIMWIYMLYYSPIIAWLVLGLSIVQIVVTMLFSKRLRNNQETIRDVTQLHMDQLENNIYNLSLIKSYMLGSKMLKNYQDILTAIRNISVKNYNDEYLLSLASTIIDAVSDIVIICLGVYGIVNGTLSIGVFVVIMSLSSSVKSLLITLANSNTTLQQYFVSLGRIMDIVNIKTEICGNVDSQLCSYQKSCEGHTKTQVIDEIEFKDISFSYIEDQNVLENINFKLIKNVINVLEGESGCGKSTIISLLLGLYRPTSGDILIGGQTLDSLDPVCKQIAVCFQTDFFVSGSVYENLKMVNPLKTDEEIKSILKLVKAEEFLDKVEDGWNCNIGTLSKKFSGGEMKRISLARTLMRDADVYIFDESFSCIDTESRNRIFANIVQYLSDKIVVVITHNGDLLNGYAVNRVKIHTNSAKRGD